MFGRDAVEPDHRSSERHLAMDHSAAAGIALKHPALKAERLH